MKDEALKLALEALQWTVEQGGGPVCEHEAGVCFCKENNAITAIKQALAAPVQEPVTDAQKRAAFESFWVTEIGNKDDLTYGGLGYAINRVAVAWETWKAAAQRQWVGLTDEEVDECYESVMFNPDIEPTRVLVYQAIEAKLKGKNT